MDSVVLTGAADPAHSFTLNSTLQPLTSALRPAVEVDLSQVIELHPSIVSVLIRHQRQARRQGGDVTLIRPILRDAARTLDHVGLVGTSR
ncbi:MAG: ABC-type transporter Mla MlaB component [Ilumatobacter sp.]|jgi:ABC-type transporter Mla MlaB component